MVHVRPHGQIGVAGDPCRRLGMSPHYRRGNTLRNLRRALPTFAPVPRDLYAYPTTARSAARRLNHSINPAQPRSWPDAYPLSSASLLKAASRTRPFPVPIPARMGHLPVDRRGYPVPFFVKRVKGLEPDFRVMCEEAAKRALRARLCWVCGGQLGRHLAFVGGPRSEASGLYADLPSHLECARFSAQACPVLANPGARMRNGGLPDGVGLLSGQTGENPRVAAVVVVREFRLDPVVGAFRIGPKEAVEWYAEGRPATAEEVAAARAGL